jgi:hypothetical protein
VIPIRQTVSHPVHGNCFEAALASLLECDLDEVPRWDEEWADYKPRLDAWLADRGLVSYPVPAVPDPRPLSEIALPDVPLLVGVKTPAAWNHALIVRGGEVVWDPYQEGDAEAGLIGGHRDPLVDYVFLLLPLDPAAAR